MTTTEYKINWSNDSIKDPFVIRDSKDTTSTSLTLFRRGTPDYGEELQEDIIRLLENFCSDVPPPAPTIGQLWYDYSNQTLKVFNGATWNTTGAYVGPTEPNRQIGVLWFDTIDKKLKYFTGTSWMIIADDSHTNDMTVHLTPEQNTWLDNLADLNNTDLNFLTGTRSNIQDQIDAEVLARTTHAEDMTKHLTGVQNTFLDGITVGSFEVNHLSGVSSNVQDQLDSKVNKAGDTMTGYLTLHAAPAQADHAANKGYIDSLISSINSGGSGGSNVLTLDRVYFAANDGQSVFTLPFAYVQGTNVLQVYVSGVKQNVGRSYIESSISTISFTTGLSAGTIVEVIKIKSGDGVYLPLTGGTLTGSLVTTGDISTIGSGEIKSGGWLRSTGNTGWKSDTYGGGFLQRVEGLVEGYNGVALKVVASPTNTNDAVSAVAGSASTSGVVGTSNDTTKYAHLGYHDTYSVYAVGDSRFEGDIYATGNITAFSDERLKTNIEIIPNALEDVRKLRGVTFTKDGKLGLGFIAQEIEKVYPVLVATGVDGYKSVAYQNMTAVLVEAVKELANRIEKLEQK